MRNSFDPVQWLEGLPRESSITDAEVRRMYELGMEVPKHPVLVELGVWQGRSAALLAKIAKAKDGTFYGIDHFQHPGCSRQKVVDRLEVRGLDRHAVIIEQSTEKVLWGGIRIDFLHVDADHTFPGIDRDCQNFVTLLKAGGIVAFDDYVVLPTEPAYPDIKRVADVWCRNEAFDDLGTADGMQFFRRKA